MVRCHYQLNGHEFEQTLGDSEGKEIYQLEGLWAVQFSSVQSLSHVQLVATP